MDHTKTLFAFFGIGIAGLMFFASGHLFPTEAEGVGQYGAMLTHYQLNAYAKEACLKAAKTRVATPLYTPAETRIGVDGSMELRWTPTAETPQAVTCRFAPEHGVSELIVDGRSFGAVGVDMREESARPEEGIKAEKHWGHW